VTEFEEDLPAAAAAAYAIADMNLERYRIALEELPRDQHEEFWGCYLCALMGQMSASLGAERTIGLFAQAAAMADAELPAIEANGETKQ